MERAPVRATNIKNLGFKVGLLLLLTGALAIGTFVYVLHARGVFEATQSLTLIASDADGVSIGMPLTFAGFPIGKVSRITLADDGQARIQIEIPEKHTRWLRKSSVFTLEKSLVGAARIRAYSNDLSAPPLPDAAEVPLLRGDVSEEIPAMVARVKRILDNLEAMTAANSNLNQSLAHVSTVTGRMAGEYGVLQGVLGSPEKARELVQTIERANRLLASLNAVSLKVDTLLAKTDQRVYGKQGVMDQADQALVQVNAILGDVRASLKRVDAILANAQEASTDVAELRVEIDDSVRKLNHLINEINRKWPFARDVEIKTR